LATGRQLLSLAFRGLLTEYDMDDLARQDTIEKALRIVAIVVAVVMLLTFASIALTGLSAYTMVCAVLLMLSTSTLFVVDLVF
jgi:hypothetical protein